MRKILIGVVAVVVLLVAAALIVPSVIDWNHYRGEIERQAEAATGRKLTIAGTLGLTVLPAPRLAAGDVRFANAGGAAAPDMVRLKALEVKVAFWPLLTGRIQVERVVLVEPVIELEVLKDGRGNWEFATPAASGGPTAASADGASRGGGLDVSLDRLTIENGTVVFRSGGAEVQRVERIDAEGGAASLQGPFRLKGTLALRGTAMTVDAEAGRFGEARTPVRLALGLVDAKATATLDAVVSAAGDQPQADGKLAVRADSIAAVVGALTGAAAGVPAVPLSLDLGFSGGPKAARIEPLQLVVADSTFSGRMEMAERADGLALGAALTTARIDVDKWRQLAAGAATAPAKPAPAKPAPAKPSPAQPTPGAATGPATGAPFALPTGIALRLELGADEIAAGGQTFRKARAVAQLQNGRLTLDPVTAEIPGPGTVKLTGALTAVQGQPSFEGRLDLATQSLRNVLAAFKALPAGLPDNRLGRTSLAVRVKAQGSTLEIQEANLAVDETRAAAAASIALRERPGIGARLTVDRINIDSYLPRGAAGARAPGAKAPAAQGGAGAADPGVDLNLEASVGQLTVGGQTARNVVVGATLQGGQLTLRQAVIGDLAGATAKLTGSVRDLGPSPTVDLALEASGPDLGRVLALGKAAAPAGASGPFTVNGKVAGTAEKLTLDTTAGLAGGQAKIAGTIEPARGAAGVALTVDVAHPSTGRLLALLSPGYRAQGGEIGPFRLGARTRAEGATVHLEGFALAAGGARIEGPVRIELGGPRPKLVADLKGSDLDLDAFLPVQQKAALDRTRHAAASPASAVRPGVILAQARRPAPAAPAPAASAAPSERWSRAPLELAALTAMDAEVSLKAASIKQGRWRVGQPDVGLSLVDGTLTLSRLNGGLYGGTFAMTGRFTAKGTPSAKLQIRAENVDVGQAVDSGGAVRLAGGRGQLEADMETVGRSPFELVGALAGKGAFAVKDGRIKGLNLAAVVNGLRDVTRLDSLLTLAQELGKDGDTPFSSLTGTFKIARGVISSDDIKMTATGFRADGTTVTSLPAWTQNTRVVARVETKPEEVPVGIRLEGPIDAPRKIFETDALQQYLTQRLGRGGLQQLVPGLGGQTGGQQGGSGLQQLLPGLLPGSRPAQRQDQAPTQPPAPAQQQQQREDQQKPSNPLDQLAPFLRR